MGDAIGEVQEADPKDKRCSVHFPSLGSYAQGWKQDEFEVVSAATAAPPATSPAR